MAPPEGTGDAVVVYYTQTRSRQGRVLCFSTEDPAPSGAGALHHRVERWSLQVRRMGTQSYFYLEVPPMDPRKAIDLNRPPAGHPEQRDHGCASRAVEVEVVFRNHRKKLSASSMKPNSRDGSFGSMAWFTDPLVLAADSQDPRIHHCAERRPSEGRTSPWAGTSRRGGSDCGGCMRPSRPRTSRETRLFHSTGCTCLGPSATCPTARINPSRGSGASA